jgi:predicted RNA polymerase sigma factor
VKPFASWSATEMTWPLCIRKVRPESASVSAAAVCLTGLPAGAEAAGAELEGAVEGEPEEGRPVDPQAWARTSERRESTTAVRSAATQANRFMK